MADTPMTDEDRLAVKRIVVLTLIRASLAEAKLADGLPRADWLDELVGPMERRLSCASFNLRRITELVMAGAIPLTDATWIDEEAHRQASAAADLIAEGEVGGDIWAVRADVSSVQVWVGMGMDVEQALTLSPAVADAIGPALVLAAKRAGGDVA